MLTVHGESEVVLSLGVTVLETVVQVGLAVLALIMGSSETWGNAVISLWEKNKIGHPDNPMRRYLLIFRIICQLRRVVEIPEKQVEMESEKYCFVPLRQFS